MDFDIWYYGQQTDIGYSKMKNAFEAGQQSKQAEIDALKAKLQELWTELDDRQSKEHIIEKCEAIIQELLK